LDSVSRNSSSQNKAYAKQKTVSPNCKCSLDKKLRCKEIDFADYFIRSFSFLLINIYVEKVNGISRSVSPSPSPEPPKLSPRSPIDYEKSKSPDAVRDSPPVLPRVYIAIQPTALECLKQNLTVTKSWHKDDGSPSLPIEKEVKVNDTDQTIIRDDITMPAISSVSSSEFEDPRNTTTNWNEEEPLPKLKNSEIEEKIPEDTKTFGDIEAHRQMIPTISSDSFLGSTMDIEIDGSDMRDTKERPVDQGHLDEVTQASEIVANKQVACEKQELEQKSNEALPSNVSIVDETRKTTEYETYNSEERINGKNRVVTSTVTAAQETSTVERSQVPAANVTNILQLQSNYYGSSVARENVVFTDVIQNSRDVQKVICKKLFKINNKHIAQINCRKILKSIKLHVLSISKENTIVL